MEIAQLLMVNEKLSSFQLKSAKIYRIARLGIFFDDYPGYQQIPAMLILLQQSVFVVIFTLMVFYLKFDLLSKSFSTYRAFILI